MPACSLLLVAALAFSLHGGASAGTPPATTERIASFASYIRTSAARYGVSDRLISAIIWVESRFDPRAVSPRGARGLMQLMPGTAAVLGVRDPFDPSENIDAGVRHLRGLMDRLDDSVPLALAAYNAGEGAVRQHRGVPPFPETQEYVTTILRLAAESGTTLPPLLPPPSAAPRPVAGPQLARVTPPVSSSYQTAPEATPARLTVSPPRPGRSEAPAAGPVQIASATPPRPNRVGAPALAPVPTSSAVPPRPSRVEAPVREPVRSVSAAPPRPPRVEVPAPAPVRSASAAPPRPTRVDVPVPEPVRSASALSERRADAPPSSAAGATAGAERGAARVEPVETPRSQRPVQPAVPVVASTDLTPPPSRVASASTAAAAERPGAVIAPASLPALDNQADRVALPAGIYRVVAGGATLYTNIPPAGRQ